MLIVQITDTHITVPGQLAYGAVDTAQCLARAVAELESLSPAPDVAIVTGDLVDLGTAEEYAYLRTLLAPLSMPLIAVPGNHDSREPMREAFASDGYLPRDGFLHFAIEDWPLRIVGLDSLVPGEVGGALCEERLSWLERTLAAGRDRPSLLLVHHPPFATGIAHLDRMGLGQGVTGLADIVRRNPQIQRILSGHVHRAIDCRFAGTIAGTAPSTAHQAVLNLAAEASLSFALEPPGYQLHRWSEDGGLVTHTAAIGDWPRLHRAGPGRLRLG